MTSPSAETVTVRKDDLELLQKVCACYAPHPSTDDIREVMERTLAAMRDPETGPEPAGEPPRPDGFYGRVEIPGMRNHTGWVTEETRFGAQLAVVRDWDGGVIAEMGIGAACRVLHLPTPLKRPEPPKAITPAWDDDDDEGLDDEDQYKDAF
jgi:hypothetical protein